MIHHHYVNEIEVIYKPRLDLTPLQKIRSDTETVEFLRSIWADDIEYRERFYAIYLNRQSKILGYYLISVGGNNGTVVDNKMVFQPAINLHSSGIVIAHNHPSGNLNPSSADIHLTKKIVDAGKALEIPILDHIILTVNSHYIFANNGNLYPI